MKGPTLVVLALLLATADLAAAQQVSGVIFDDVDGDGVRAADEPGVEGVSVRLFGRSDAGGAVDEVVLTGADGSFSFTPGNGCYLLRVEDPPQWRRTLGRTDERAEGSPGYTHPVGLRRYAVAPNLLDNLSAGSVLYSSMGDSIAWNWNSCFDTSAFWYSKQVRDRLRCVAPDASVQLDEAAIKGEHTDDLLVDEGGETNNVFRVIEEGAQLVTISIIGNDLLNNEPGANPTQEEINIAAAEMIDSRANLQEILSALVSELPQADVELNTLYDNLAWSCPGGDSQPFHIEWLPILNQMLRDVAWGQTRRVTNAEVFLEYSHEDLQAGCNGFQNQICHILGDDIHPRGRGYEIIREKLWEALGGVNLGPKDPLGATSATGVDHGYLRRVRRLYPTTWETRNGAQVTDPEAALDGADSGAGASVRLGIGQEEFRLAGFPDWYDEIVPSRVIAGIRYRTTGTVTDDFYRVEASVGGLFRAPAGHAFKPTDWDYYTPIVGSGGPNKPDEDPDYGDMKTLVVPNVPTYRTVSATLTRNPEISADGRGYTWPPLTMDEVASTAFRLLASPVAGTAGDDYQVVIDAVWLDIYGQEKQRPPEVTGLAVARLGDGALEFSFDELAGSAAYSLYAGSLAPLHARGAFDHGGASGFDPRCDAPTSPAGDGRLKTTVPAAEVPAGDRYFLVTGHVDGVESPSGFTSGGQERTRSESTCP
ncbi:MAG: GDSL-type esterase/lipase family protein [Acidobacteriota bacterium]|nr:GDSL-type esterase/lipase family protein [Acidobacteriota bacterium]